MNGAIYVSDSKNSKISGSEKIDATYASISATCPDCLLKDNGCYAQNSYVGIQVSKLNAESTGLSAIQVARAEAKAIDNCYNGGSIPDNRDMRLHVSGDSRTITGTRIINAAVGRWKMRGGRDCWSYTHAWKNVPKSEWSNVSILASITTIDEVKDAKKQGYAPAIVVPSFKSDKAFIIDGSDTKWIPCPAQTRDIPCVNCRLCFNADRLHENNFGIAFEAHGVKKNNIKKHLAVVV